MFGFLSKLFGGGLNWTAEERELLREAALADPDDHRPRLRLAEALERRGEPLGEYIRLTHEAEALPPGDPGRAELDERLQALLDAHGKAWCRPLRRIGLEPQVGGHFYPPLYMTHGVFDRIQLDRPGILPERAAELFDAMPGLRAIEVAYVGHDPSDWLDIPAIVRLPQVGQLGELLLASIVTTLGDLRAVAASPRVKNLRVLTMRGNFGPEAGRLIAASRSLGRLRELELGDARIGDDGAAALAGSANLSGVVALTLAGIVYPASMETEELLARLIGPDGAAALARSPHLAAVRSLNLSNNRLAGAGTQALAGSPHLRLTKVILPRCRLGAEGGRALRSAAWLAGVTELNLNDNSLGDEGVGGLAGAGRLASLRVLDLGFNQITGAGLQPVLTGGLPALSELRLTGNHIGPDGAAALARAALPRLSKFEIAYNPLGDAGAVALAGAPLLESLTELNLSGAQIGPEGVGALAGSPRLRNVRTLQLSQNPVGDEGGMALVRSPHLTKLESLGLNETNIGERTKKRMFERFGNALYW